MFEVLHRAASGVSGLTRTVSDAGLQTYEAKGSHFRLEVYVVEKRSFGLSFRVEGSGCRSIEFEQDNDLYPVTGLKFGPIALDLSEDFAAWIRAFADRRLLVGCRRGGMTFTIPLVEERLYAWKGRIFLNTKSIPLDGGTDDFSDLVPVQDWPAAR